MSGWDSGLAALGFRIRGNIVVILGLYGIMEKKMETTIMCYIGYRIWGIQGG